jgi:hypothetical protein
MEPSIPAQASPSAPALKVCPFCASPAQLNHHAGDPPRFGVTCIECRASVPTIYPTQDAASAAWGRRRGTASASGGRATKGVMTRRKRRACRANLVLARTKKKINRLRAGVLAAMPILQLARRVEIAEAEAAASQYRARLKVWEPQILADPFLKAIYELFPSRSAGDELQ